MKLYHSVVLAIFIGACQNIENSEGTSMTDELPSLEERLEKYIEVPLETDLAVLSDAEKNMIPILIEAAEIMDDLFWYEAYGEKDALFTETTDPSTQKFLEINYGPWDRLDGDASFLKSFEKKPAGANFYPADITKEEFESWTSNDKTSLYSIIRRDDNGELTSIPYREMFGEQIVAASQLLKQAAELAPQESLKKYLNLRAEALLTDEYQPSDMAWLDMKDNIIEVVIGPIETYEDQLYGYKAAHQAYILIKDVEWSERLEKFGAFLPQLQRGLPVTAEYKAEMPGTDTELNAYDVIYYAGQGNSGSKTIAINLPNDEQVQLEKGTRRLQLKNSMRAKFDEILVPISNVLIDPSQRKHISFDAFFANTMFHEVAHGLGIKNTITDKGTVRMALQEHASALEEGKADILGLYMIRQLHELGEIEGDLEDFYVTFMASIFRSVRFGASSAHGKANMIRFNYFQERGAFTRDETSGTYKVDFAKLEEAAEALSNKILTLQGDGDYPGVAELIGELGVIEDGLQADLDRLAAASIPVDIVFDQGLERLGM